MHTFGSSAPLKDLLIKFGFTPETVVAAAKVPTAINAIGRSEDADRSRPPAETTSLTAAPVVWLCSSGRYRSTEATSR